MNRKESSCSMRKLIIGAGDAGTTLLREIQRGSLDVHHIVGFLDDAAHLQNGRILGLPVLGAITDLRAVCSAHSIQEVLIAIPSAPQRRIREIFSIGEGIGVSFRIVPGLSELIEGSLTIESQLRRVRLEDLLTRDPVELDSSAISRSFRGKRVMVTGAGGSIGSELCRQILQYEPGALTLVEQSENGLFDIERELRNPARTIRPVLGDISDRGRMERVFDTERPDIVCHAAAHKHVPMIEQHPGEGLRNNVVGTRWLADLAAERQLEKFVFVSTDKAINPTSVMGCTKRIAEMYTQALDQSSRTRFVTVRFGNVLGSRGSVVPVFQEQIATGGPLTVTHPDATRYFMTIREAAQLVLQAGALGHGGEIFLLEMGAPVRIVDLARHLITLSGLTPDIDVPVRFVGLRPGEKLHEDLCLDGEDIGPTDHPSIRIWRSRPALIESMRDAVAELQELVHADTATIRCAIRRIVPEYCPSTCSPNDQPDVVNDETAIPMHF
jgi:FlaA1/EpsC-like NDP-sugar epimerase